MREPACRLEEWCTGLASCVSGCSVFLRGQFALPVHRYALLFFGNGDMRHGLGWGCTMPMQHMGRNGDYITHSHGLCGLALLLHQTNTIGDNQGLPQWVGVPSGVCPCIKLHSGAACSAWRLRCKRCTHAHLACKVLLGSDSDGLFTGCA